MSEDWSEMTQRKMGHRIPGQPTGKSKRKKKREYPNHTAALLELVSRIVAMSDRSEQLWLISTVPIRSTTAIKVSWDRVW